MKQLLEAGYIWSPDAPLEPENETVHFTERNGIYIIDLQKTVKEVEKAYYFVRDIAMDNKTVLLSVQKTGSGIHRGGSKAVRNVLCF